MVNDGSREKAGNYAHLKSLSFCWDQHFQYSISIRRACLMVEEPFRIFTLRLGRVTYDA